MLQPQNKGVCLESLSMNPSMKNGPPLPCVLRTQVRRIPICRILYAEWELATCRVTPKGVIRTIMFVTNCQWALPAKFQFDECFRRNDTERVWAVTKRIAPSTHCQRRLAAKFQYVELIRAHFYTPFSVLCDLRSCTAPMPPSDEGGKNL